MKTTNGHVLKECECLDPGVYDTCPVCVWGASICKNCGSAEGQLSAPCTKQTTQTKESMKYALMATLGSFHAGRYISRSGVFDSIDQSAKFDTIPEVLEFIQRMAQSRDVVIHNIDIVQLKEVTTYKAVVVS